MKNFILKWLGLSGVAEQAAQLEKALNTKDLRRLVSDAVCAVIEGRDREFWGWDYDVQTKFQITLDAAVMKHSKDEVSKATKVATDLINKTIGTEKFIDEIVARIQRKQL